MSYCYGDDFGDRMDADLEMAELTRLGNRSAALRRRGVCTHGAYRSRPASGAAMDADQAAIPPGGARCSDCGKVFDREDDLHSERRELLS